MDALVPGDLHVLTIGLERLEHLDLVALLNRLQWASKDVVLLHVVTHIHVLILESLLGADKLVPQVKELFEALAPQNELRLHLSITAVDPQDRVASPNVLDQKRVHRVDIVFDRPLHVKFEVDQMDVAYGARTGDGFDNR